MWNTAETSGFTSVSNGLSFAHKVHYERECSKIRHKGKESRTFVLHCCGCLKKILRRNSFLRDHEQKEEVKMRKRILSSLCAVAIMAYATLSWGVSATIENYSENFNMDFSSNLG